MIDAAAEVGLLEREFWQCTPRYFYAKTEARRVAYQQDLERTRMISYFIVKTVDSKNKIKRPQDLMRFDWEQPRFKKLTEKDKDALRKFDEEADLILKKTNPEAYAKYMEGKHKN